MTLEDQLIRDEGEILHAYQDSLGFWTIGTGILIDARNGGGITHEENLYLLRNRIEHASAMLRTRLPWTINLDEVRRAALINMTFQLGVAGLLAFNKFLGFMQAGSYSEASKEMLDSKWAEQCPARAHRLSIQIESGLMQ